MLVQLAADGEGRRGGAGPATRGPGIARIAPWAMGSRPMHLRARGAEGVQTA